jgi:hypothetical protein
MRWAVVVVILAMAVPAIGQDNTDILRKLSVEQARTLIATYGSDPLSFDGLTTLSPEVAEALANHKGQLDLNGLTTLSPEVAEALATHEGLLFLNGLTTLSPESAAALATHEGAIVFDGLTTLSPEVAEALATHKGGVFLTRLTTLSPKVAEALATHKGQLVLSDLKTLSPELAAALATHKGELCLNGLTTLSPEVAEALATHKGVLVLSGLTTLTPELAATLATHNGQLVLDGLKTLSPGVAEALAKHKGDLSIKGLTTLMPEVARPPAAPREKAAGPFPISWDEWTQITGPESGTVRFIRDKKGNLCRVEARYAKDLVVAVTEVEGGFRVTLGSDIAVADFATRPWFTKAESDGLIDAWGDFVEGRPGGKDEKVIGRFLVQAEKDPDFPIKSSLLLRKAAGPD